MRFSDEKIEAARNFANKLWNASRFVRMNLSIDQIALPADHKLATEDKWVLTEYQKTVKTVNDALNSFEVGVALNTLYNFTWDIFCDWYIELCKARLNDKDSEGNIIAQHVLCYVLDGILKLLHPFMPFITEEIYSSLPHADGAPESIMIASYPTFDEHMQYDKESEHMAYVIDAIRAIRNRRAEMNIVPSRRAKVYIETKYADAFPPSAFVFFERLASASEVQVATSFDGILNPDETVQIVTSAATVYLPLSDMIDTEKEKARLQAEGTRLEKEIERAMAKLANESFVAKAPAAVVAAERAKLEKYRENLIGVQNALSKLS